MLAYYAHMYNNYYNIKLIIVIGMYIHIIIRHSLSLVYMNTIS